MTMDKMQVWMKLGQILGAAEHYLVTEITWGYDHPSSKLARTCLEGTIKDTRRFLSEAAHTGPERRKA